MPVRSGGLDADRWVLVALIGVAGLVGAVHGDFTDLSVYRHAGQTVLDGRPLATDDPVTGLPFTYPPFAAVLMVPLALIPGTAAAALWTAGSAAALVATVAVVRRALGRPASTRVAIAVAVGALALEPVWQDLAFGQVNLVLMLLVLLDVLMPERRFSGVVLGLAAAVKLTPLFFVGLLVLVGCRRAAGRAMMTFVAAMGVGFAAKPGDSTAYWGDRLLDPRRVGPPSLTHNQSVHGVLTRLLEGPPPTVLWLGVAVPLAVLALLVAAVWWRGGDRVLGAGLAALGMLLASPLSWSHHWVWVLPLGLALWERSRVAAVAWAAVFAARPILWPPWGEQREYSWNALEQVLGSSYVLAAVVVLACAAPALRGESELQGRQRRDGGPQRLSGAASASTPR